MSAKSNSETRDQTKLKLPRLNRVSLRNFSLYAVNPDAEFECGEGVLCLTGANGLGKSTLLTAINFCFTGIVSEPGREFRSMEEYYDEGKKYSSRYFRGRITESMRSEAEITLEFSIGNLQYVIKRGLFESEELRSLRVTKGTGVVELETDELSRHERHRKYESQLASDIGLTSFAEFVFLQLFVFTFDERRITLFWDQQILERALYIAFGLDPGMAKRVDTINREYESADSQVRNRQYDLTRTRRLVTQLKNQAQQATSSQESYEQLAAEHEQLTEAYEIESRILEDLNNQVKDANRRLAALSAQEAAHRDEYDQFFEEGLTSYPPLAQNPLFAKSLSEQICAMCGADSEQAISKLRSKSQAKNCPICETLLPEQPPKEDMSQLQDLDKKIGAAKQSIREVLKELDRLGIEETAARKKTSSTKVRLDAFETENERAMLTMRQTLDGAGNLATQIASFQTQIERYRREKSAAELRRSELKRELNKYRSDLQSQYMAMERDFVPTFTDLAFRFLGMTMEIRMVSTESDGIKLVIDVRGTTRRQSHQLSESQRFFLDIALRMAMTRFISDPISRGGLYIDTPEGSLDLAYERRAGEMLAKFVEPGFRVLMTANLNSSKLLIALAKNCGRQRLKLCRMTEWAELSEVQEEAGADFEAAYNEIEAQFAPQA